MLKLLSSPSSRTPNLAYQAYRSTRSFTPIPAILTSRPANALAAPTLSRTTTTSTGDRFAAPIPPFKQFTRFPASLVHLLEAPPPTSLNFRLEQEANVRDGQGNVIDNLIAARISANEAPCESIEFGFLGYPRDLF